MKEWLRGLLAYLLRHKPWWIVPPLALFGLYLLLVVVTRPAPAPRPAPSAGARTIDVTERLRAGEGVFENTPRPALDRHWLMLHPNEPNAPPAQLVLPVEIDAGSCFSSDLVVDSAQSDGVRFEVEIRDGASAALVVTEELGPARPRHHLLGVALEAWAGRKVDLILRTRPGATPNYDWSYFVGARIGPCRAD